MNLQDIIELCKNDEGKVFVMNAEGEVSLVVLSMGQYKRLLSQPQRKIVDPELVNKHILRAQLESDPSPQQEPVRSPHVTQTPVVTPSPKVDLREEVIDPSFDFEASEDL